MPRKLTLSVDKDELQSNYDSATRDGKEVMMWELGKLALHALLRDDVEPPDEKIIYKVGFVHVTITD
jgi:hypothetical protein